MDNLIFSLNSTMPVFLVIAIGYILKRIGMLDDRFVKPANKFNFKVTLPALLFRDMLNTDFKSVFDGRYVAFCAIATTASVLIIWIVAKLFMKDKHIVGEFVQSSYRGSAAVLGSAFVLNMYGTTGMIPLMIIGSVPLFNIFAVVILVFEAEGDIDKKKKIGGAFINILKNPIIISIVAGVILSLLNVDFPKLVDSTIDNFAKMATPLALVCIGVAFEGSKAIKLIKPTVIATFIKLAVLPAVFLPIAALMGFEGQKLVALVIMLGAPTTPSCFIMAKSMGHDGVLTTGSIVLTTLMSTLSITLILFVLKTLSLI